MARCGAKTARVGILQPRVVKCKVARRIEGFSTAKVHVGTAEMGWDDGGKNEGKACSMTDGHRQEPRAKKEVPWL